jgi:8-oxo-dGTP diphosphatase
VPIAEVDHPPLALDHADILAAGVERARSKLEYTSLAAALVSEPFSLADLRHVYEAVWGAPLDPGNFRRKVLSTPGFVEPVEEVAPPGPGGGRPARLYRRGGSRLLHPAMLRPSSAGGVIVAAAQTTS